MSLGYDIVLITCTNAVYTWGVVHYFNKNSDLKFRKFHVPNGIVQSSWTDPTQTTAHLVIVLESRIQKSGTGDNNFVKWKGTFRSNRPKWPDCSKRSTFKAGSEYSSWTKSKWSFPLKSTNWNLWNFGLNGKHHWLPPFFVD